MLSNLSSPFDLALLIVGSIFLLKKFGAMDRYLGLRVVVFTSILSCAFIYFSLGFLGADLFRYQDCVIEFSEPGDQF